MMRFLALLTATAVVAAPRQNIDAVIDRAVSSWSKTTSAHASFEQTLTNPLTGSTMTARGEYDQKQPNKLAVRFSDPKGDMIISDGSVVWVYLPSTNPGQVVKMAAGAAFGSVDLAGQFFTSPRERYRITDAGTAKVSGRATHALQLVPKKPMQFTRATVWIDDANGILRQFEIEEPSGLVRRVRLTSVQVNARVSDKAFRFTPPAGIRVVDQAALSGQK